jgi:hypothetical protein
MSACEAELESDGESSPPEVVRDWLVHSVQIERRGHGDVVSIETLDRMQVWDDEGCGGEYLLDLSPV